MSPTIKANVQWADNTDQLKQRLLEGTGQIIAMKDAVDRTAAAMGGSGLLAAANKVTAAIDQIGGVTKLTSSEIDRQTILIDKAIEKYQALGLTAPQAMQDLSTQLHTAGQETGGFTAFLEGLGHSMVARIAEGVLLRDAVREVVDLAKKAAEDTVAFFVDSVKASGELEAAEARLSGALLASGRAADGSLGSFKSLASTISATTTTSKTAALEMEARFVQLGQVSESNMGGATQAALDLSAGLRIDLDSAVTLISKSLEGNSTSLKRLGVDLDASRVKAEGASYIFGALNDRFGGQAQLQAETYAGRIAQIGNAWEEVKAKVGDAITQDPLVVAGLRDIDAGLTEIAKNADSGRSSFGEFSANVAEGAVHTGGVILLLTTYFEHLADEANRVAQIGDIADAAAKRAPSLAAPLEVFTAASVRLTSAQIAANKAFDDSVAIRAGFSDQQKGWIDANIAEGLGVKETSALLGLNEVAVKVYVDAHQKALEATKKFNDEQDKLKAKLFDIEHGLDGAGLAFDKLGSLGEKAAVKVQSLSEALGLLQTKAIATGKLPYGDALGPAQNLLDGELVPSGSGAGSIGTDNLGAGLNATYFGKGVDQAKTSTESLSKTLGTLSQSLAQLATISGGTFGGIVRDLAQVVSEADVVAKAVDEIGKAGDGVVGSIEKISSVFSLISAGISFVGSIIKDLNIGGPSADEIATRTLQSNAFKPLESATDTTGIQTAENALTQMGFTAQQAQTYVAAALNAKTPAAFAAAMGPVNIALKQVSDTSNAVTGVTSLASAYINAGHVMPPAMLATITQLASMPGLTADESKALNDLVASAKPNFENLESKAAGLGITLAQLGPGFEQGDLSQKFGDVWQNIQDLVNAGGDLGGILQGYGPKIGDLVEESKAFGTTIPDNMKPYLQSLVDAGGFTDAAGDKIKDLNGVKFAPTVQSSLDTMNTTLGTLTGVLAGLPAQISAAFQFAAGNPFAEWSLEGLDAAGNAFNPIVNLPTGPDTPTYNLGATYLDTSPGAYNPKTGGHFSTGGMFTPSGDVQYFADGYPGGGKVLQFAPRGSDVQAAMIGLDEMVLNANQQKAVGALIKRGAGTGSSSTHSGTGPAAAPISITIASGAIQVTVPPGADAKATADAIQTMLERKLMPALTKALQDNRGGARTHMLEALGIAS